MNNPPKESPKRHFPLQLMDRGHDLWAEREASKQPDHFSPEVYAGHWERAIAKLKRQALHKTLALCACMAFLSVHLKPCLFLLRQGISDFTRSGAIQCDPPTVVRGLLLASYE